jgi:CRP/FNR family nitrogen fixation transcriptional regulator
MSALFEPPDFEQRHVEGIMPATIDAASFAASACLKRVKAGATLYVEGDPAPYCYQVADGYVKEYNTLEDGRRQITDFYSVGEMFGISDGEEHLYTAEAISDSVVRYYPREMLARASSSPAMSRYFFDMLVSRLNRSRERIIMLGRMNAAQRVAAFLFHLSEERRSAKVIDLPMSRQDIADHLGLTTETVCRSLTELKRKGFITMPSARRFSVCDGPKLADAVHGASDLI